MGACVSGGWVSEDGHAIQPPAASRLLPGHSLWLSLSPVLCSPVTPVTSDYRILFISSFHLHNDCVALMFVNHNRFLDGHEEIWISKKRILDHSQEKEFWFCTRRHWAFTDFFLFHVDNGSSQYTSKHQPFTCKIYLVHDIVPPKMELKEVSGRASGAGGLRAG